jgi:hypothetical protein
MLQEVFVCMHYNHLPVAKQFFEVPVCIGIQALTLTLNSTTGKPLISK